jgi:LPXTG-motif cell wall-anchored protein
MTINPSLSRRPLVLAGRVAAGLAVSAATLTMLGGSAFASDDPIIPMPDSAFEPVFELEPIDPIDPPFSTIPLDIPELPEDDGPILTIPDDIFIPELTVPDDDGPVLTIPGLDIPELPLCVVWNPADVAVTSVDNGDLTATVTIVFSGPDAVCDELLVVHSTQEDAAMNPLALLAEEHVTLAELVADDDNTIAVNVPLDPCYTRVFTHGPEALLMQDDHYGEGCPDPTTTTAPPVETTEPPVETTDPTVPTTVPPTVPQPGPTTTIPSGTLPQTGSSASVIVMLGGALVLAGGALAIGVRKSQSTGY